MKKRVIDSRREFDMYSSLMTEKAFFAKYRLSMKLTAELAAEDAMFNSAFGDRALNKEDGRKELKIPAATS